MPFTQTIRSESLHLLQKPAISYSPTLGLVRCCFVSASTPSLCQREHGHELKDQDPELI